MSEQSTSGSYRIELLGSNNWVPWKRRISAILRDLGLEEYIEKDSMPPEAVNPASPTEEEVKVLKQWRTGDAKARTRIELAIGDAEMIHISGAATAREMWEQLTMVKESRGRLGVLATRRALYRATADENFEMVEHISKLRKLQEELHIMGSPVPDEDFVMILITSLPESWDNYTSAYLGSSGNKPELRSHEIIAILLDEDRRRKGRSGNSADAALQAKGKAGYGKKGKDSDKECYNCGKKGHISKECWSKGGGMEGKGPKGRKGPKREKANQAKEVNNDLNEVSYLSRDLPVPFEIKNGHIDIGEITFMANISPNNSKNDWYLDSGTTSHISNDRNAYSEFYPIQATPVRGIGTPASALGFGSLSLDFRVSGKTLTHKLKNVLYIPEAPNCLLSVSRLDENDGRIIFHNRKCQLENKEGNIIGHGGMKGRLYLLDAKLIQTSQETSHYSSSPKITWDQWHRRYGHISVTSLERLSQNGMVSGLLIDQSSKPSITCEACIQAKQAHKPFPKEAEHKSETPGERIMSDVWGPARVESIGRWKWYISFIDDCTRYSTILFLKHKGEATDRIKEHITKVERNFGKAPKWMRFDNGKELVNEETKKWAAQKGIIIETTAPYSPSQNGVAERFNRTIMELARAMLISSGLPTFLWDEAASHANYLRNRAPTRALQGITPYEAWTGKKPDVGHLREFGCDVWVLDESNNRSKLDPKSKKMVFVGFMDGPKAIRYYDAKTRSIKVSRNVAFNENEQPTELVIVDIPGVRVEGEIRENPSQQPVILQKPAVEPLKSEPRQLRQTGFIDYTKINNPDARKPTRRVPIPETPKTDDQTNLAEELFLGTTFLTTGTEEDLPKSYEEAIKGPEADQWKEAMDAEIGQLEEMGTWEEADLPEGRKEIGCRWVFLRKKDEHGNIIKYKARLVAQGFSQKPGVDYSDNGTFAPVMRFETLRTMLAQSAIHNWKLRQFDIKGAYLHGYLEEEIYMAQPPGYGDGSQRVRKLIRALYGLKQAGNVWNTKLNDALINLGFRQLKSDYCCYIRQDGDNITILLVWVDDFLSISNKDTLNDQIEAELRNHFEVKSLGKPSIIIGVKIRQENNLIEISQTHYIETLLKKYGLQDANPVSTPMDPNVKLDDPEETSDESGSASMATFGYANLIGSLMYLAIATRPDIAYAINKLAQFTSAPKPKHWTAVKRIFRYLKGTKDYKLTYGGSQDLLNEELNIYCDADWASDLDRKSISGYVITIAGGAVAWSSKKQTTVAPSTPEAEYIAAAHAAKQVLWYRSLLTELNFSLTTPSTIFSDNQSAISIAHHPEFHARTKHIDIAVHFLRDHVKKGTLDLYYINTEYNLADIFTKALKKPSHINFTHELGVLSGQGGVL